MDPTNKRRRLSTWVEPPANRAAADPPSDIDSIAPETALIRGVVGRDIVEVEPERPGEGSVCGDGARLAARHNLREIALGDAGGLG